MSSEGPSGRERTGTDLPRPAREYTLRRGTGSRSCPCTAAPEIQAAVPRNDAQGARHHRVRVAYEAAASGPRPMAAISIRWAARHATPQASTLTVPRRQLRLVYLITSRGGFWGGAESQVHSLARSFRQRGWDVGVVSMLPNEFILVDLEGEGIRVATLGLRGGVPDPEGCPEAPPAAATLEARCPARSHGARQPPRAADPPVSKTPVLISTIHNENEGSQWRYRRLPVDAPVVRCHHSGERTGASMNRSGVVQRRREGVVLGAERAQYRRLSARPSARARRGRDWADGRIRLACRRPRHRGQGARRHGRCVRAGPPGSRRTAPS